MAKIIRALYSPVGGVPPRFEKIKGKMIDFREANDTSYYIILDTYHNREIFKEVGVKAYELIDNNASYRNVKIINFKSNQQAASLLRRS